MPLSVACSDEQQVPITATPITATGKAARVDGPLRITVQSGDGTFLQDAASPLAFKVVSGVGPAEGSPPDATVDTVYLVEADANLGAGVELIQDLVTLSVTTAGAAAFGLSASAAEPKA